jgi:hypothetical protein
MKSAPDGYTLLVGTVTTHAVSASLYSKLPFDPQRDFTPIIEWAHIPQMLSVHPSDPRALGQGSGGAGEVAARAVELRHGRRRQCFAHGDGAPGVDGEDQDGPRAV